MGYNPEFNFPNMFKKQESWLFEDSVSVFHQNIFFNTKINIQHFLWSACEQCAVKLWVNFLSYSPRQIK